jgi:uncharacterized protein YegL
LSRVGVFPMNKFTILNLEKVGKRHLRAIRDSVGGSSKIRLHLVQREPVLSVAIPVYENIVWGSDTCNGTTITPRSWQSLKDGNGSVRSATLVVSSSCCAGKTRFIRRQQEDMATADPKAEIGIVTVHERSTAASLATAIASKFSMKNNQKSLHISVLSIPRLADESLRASFIHQLNRFFLDLFVLGSLHHSDSQQFLLRGEWQVFVELPTNEVSSDNALEWSRAHVPLLALACRLHEVSNLFEIDRETRRVCVYLQALDDGSINNKFEPSTRKQIIFVLDQSESMEMEIFDDPNKTQLSMATDCALRIFDSHCNNDDEVGLIMFNHNCKTVIPLQRIQNESHKNTLRAQLNEARHDIPLGGGTHMYSALSMALENANQDPSVQTWIICLTDGDTDRTDTENRLRDLLVASHDSLNLIIIGVNLFSAYEDKMRLLCRKYSQPSTRRTKGFYVGAEATSHSLSNAFLLVSQSIPVSQTLDLHGEPNDDDCRRLIHKHAPKDGVERNMQLLNFWIRFLYRRVRVLDNNDFFNFNQTIPNLGECLMKTMLDEVERLLKNHQDNDWLDKNYSQLIYDFSVPESPQFRLLCTSPRLIEASLHREYERCGFEIPTESALAKRETLDSLISQAMNIPLLNGRLAAIDDHSFVLTLDFAIKLVNINERVATNAPCIIEGETGAGKTFLSKMFGILINSSLASEAKKNTLSSLEIIEEEARCNGFTVASGRSTVDRLEATLRANQGARPDAETLFSAWLHEKLTSMCSERPPIFERAPASSVRAQTSAVIELLKWVRQSRLESTFFELNVHSSITEGDVVAFFEPIRELARKLASHSARIVVFLDEINTSSAPGLFKEIVVDGSLQGEQL